MTPYLHIKVNIIRNFLKFSNVKMLICDFIYVVNTTDNMNCIFLILIFQIQKDFNDIISNYNLSQFLKYAIGVYVNVTFDYLT